MREDITKELTVPEGVTVSYVDGVLTVKGSQGEVSKDLFFPTIELKSEAGKIVLTAKNGSKREKRMVGTFQAHIKNMFKGVQEKFQYKLKICSGHFPMNVAVSGNNFSVKNFLGEKHPRVFEIPQGVAVKVNGSDVEVVGCSKEATGQTAAKIEQLCKITNKDLRIFQDGIYITQKA